MGADSPSSGRSNDSSIASIHKEQQQKITTTQRNRENQRLSRARRKDYVASLEAKVRDYERRGANATVEMQKAARDVVRENLMLKEQLTNSAVCQSCGARNGDLHRVNGSSISSSSNNNNSISISESSISAEIRRRGIPGIDGMGCIMDVDPLYDSHRRRLSSAHSVSNNSHAHSLPDNLYRLASISSTYSHSSASSEAGASPSPSLSYVTNAPSNPPPLIYRQPPVVLPPPVQPNYYNSNSSSSNGNSGPLLPPISQGSIAGSISPERLGQRQVLGGVDISPKSYPSRGYEQYSNGHE